MHPTTSSLVNNTTSSARANLQFLFHCVEYKDHQILTSAHLDAVALHSMFGELRRYAQSWPLEQHRQPLRKITQFRGSASSQATQCRAGESSFGPTDPARVSGHAMDCQPRVSGNSDAAGGDLHPSVAGKLEREREWGWTSYYLNCGYHPCFEAHAFNKSAKRHDAPLLAGALDPVENEKLLMIMECGA